MVEFALSEEEENAVYTWLNDNVNASLSGVRTSNTTYNLISHNCTVVSFLALNQVGALGSLMASTPLLAILEIKSYYKNPKPVPYIGLLSVEREIQLELIERARHNSVVPKISKASWETVP